MGHSVPGNARRSPRRSGQRLGTVHEHGGRPEVVWCTGAREKTRAGELEVKDLWTPEKVKSHELRISFVMSEDNRAELLTKFLEPERHEKLI